jgi:RNA polymerase sigma-70 factor, ECF subfamily
VAVRADSLFEGHPADDGAVALAGELFRQHSRMVFAVCRRLLPDTAEAEDAMQQTFVSAYRSLLAGSEPRQGDVWLAAIARNECLDRIRARMREPLAEHGRNGGSEAQDTLSAVIAGEEFRALSRSIEELPTQQRDALLLHEFCGLPYGEVAAAIGVSESAIGSLLFRARRTLRTAFRRGYAVLPLPEIWNASAQLLARGPAIKVAALSVVAKVGCGAVAVGLTAGAVVAVEHEVETQARPRSVTHVAAAPETLSVARARRPVSQPVVVRSEALASATAKVAPVTSERPGRSSPPRREHRPRSIPTTTAGRLVSAQEPAQLVSVAVAPPSRHTRTPVSGKSSSHVSTGSGHVKKRRSHGRSSTTTKSTKQYGKREAARPTQARGNQRPRPATTEPAATAPGLARGHDEHGPPVEGETVDASFPSAEAAPSASSTDHPEHPDHPDHPGKS